MSKPQIESLTQQSPEMEEVYPDPRTSLHPPGGLRRAPVVPSPLGYANRGTPELRHLQIAASLSSTTKYRQVIDDLARVLSTASGQEVDPEEDVEQVLRCFLIQRAPSNASGGQLGTPDGRHTIDRELQLTARMAPRTVDVRRTPERRADPVPAAPVPHVRYEQAPCTFSSAKSDRSVRSDTKCPKPTHVSRLDGPAVPPEIIRPRPSKKVVPSASSAFSQHSEGSINCSDDYRGRVAKSE